MIGRLGQARLASERRAGDSIIGERGRFRVGLIAISPLWHEGHRATLRPSRGVRVGVFQSLVGKEPV